MNSTFLLLGGNLGHPKQNFVLATQFISEKIGTIKNRSSLFKSKAWGFEAETDFLNQVLQVETKLTAIELLQETQKIEQQIGRKSKTIKENYQSRELDIDILFYNNEIINTPNLVIPHPRLHLRNFTLAPLQEIAPHFIHPQFKKTIHWLSKHSKDDSIVEILA